MTGMLRSEIDRALRDESGYSLPELLVAAAIGLLVAAIGLLLLSVAVRTEPVLAERSAQVQQGRAMIERLAQELRQGETTEGASSSGLEILTYVNSETCGGIPAPEGLPCKVIYSCSSSACTRTERNPDGSGTTPAETLVDGIIGPAVFTYQPSPADPEYVGVTLRFPRDNGQEAVTLRDGVTLRNYVESASG